MRHFSGWVTRLQLRTALWAVVISGLAFNSAAIAADYDFTATPSGNYNNANNWYIYGDPIGDPDAVPPEPPTPPSQPTSPPMVTDNAYVRNGGQLLVDGDWQIGDTIAPNSLGLRIGWRRQVPVEDPQNPGTYIPDTYTEMGDNGSMLWTAGEITGKLIDHPDLPGMGFMKGGPALRIGSYTSLDVDEDTELQYTGTVVQNGPTTKILLQFPESRLRIGDHDAIHGTPNPTSSYTLVNGTIGTGVGVNGYGGGNENNGIDVRNGYFTMTGGQIIDATPESYFAFGLVAQRFLTISSKEGANADSMNYAEATLSGGSIDVLGGIRITTQEYAKGVLNINGPVTIKTGGDSTIGHNALGEAVMNMSDGSLSVGRTDIPNLDGRLHVGNRGLGKLNMSGGSITIANDIRVGADGLAGGSEIYMTGGSITTPHLNLRNSITNLVGEDLGASLILDGSPALFTSNTVNIGTHGKGKIEIREGHAHLGVNGGNINLSPNTDSASTLILSGGKITLGGPVLRSQLSAPTPVVQLTGGTLEFNNTTTANAHSFATTLNNDGAHLITKPNAQLQVTVGSVAPAVPADFIMSSGSWDIDLGLNLANPSQPSLGGDFITAANGTASLTGGTLNINYLSGFAPTDGAMYRILRGGLGTTLNAANVTITGMGAGNWVLQENVISGANEEIVLKYVAATGVPGDFNGDGAVNGADYVVWAKGGPLLNDPTPGVQPADYDFWRSRYGATSGGAGAGDGSLTSAVPEPSSTALVMIAIVGLLGTTGARQRTSVQSQCTK